MNPDLTGIYELHTVGRINLLDSSASSLKMITIVAQDDIDEMRAEEQAQQAEAQITMFELLRYLLLPLLMTQSQNNLKKSNVCQLSNKLIGRSPTLRMPLTIAIMMQLSQQVFHHSFPDCDRPHF